MDGLVFHGDHSATHDLVSDREGRSYSSRGPGRSAIDSRSDPHRDLKTKFAHQLAVVLACGVDQNSYDRSSLLLRRHARRSAGSDLRPRSRQSRREVAQDLTKFPRWPSISNTCSSLDRMATTLCPAMETCFPRTTYVAVPRVTQQ